MTIPQLSDMSCEVCGVKSVISLSGTEGPRCDAHSSYSPRKSEESNRLGNILAARKYKQQLEEDTSLTSTVRSWLESAVKKAGQLYCNSKEFAANPCQNVPNVSHLCPFKVEMEDDPEKKALTGMCNCCDTCERECREAI